MTVPEMEAFLKDGWRELDSSVGIRFLFRHVGKRAVGSGLVE